jgi:hypothetical protein
MIPDRDAYDEAEWAASAGHGPLLASKAGEAFLIYRHWVWANLQRISFEQSLESKETFDPPEMVMVGRGPIFMFVWYGLLWSVIEAIEERKFDLRGPLRDDIAPMRDALKHCRNAIMHVPRSNNLLDPRIQTFIELPASVLRIRRIHHGLGRLLRDEVRRQSELLAPAVPPASTLE